MRIYRLLAILVYIVTSLSAAAQHTITLRGDTVTSVTIKEDNSYCDRSKRPPEMVYPPSAWVGYMAWDGKHQILLERNASCTKSTEMDSATWLLELRPYTFSTVGVDSKDDLVKTKFGEYGEMNKGWTSEDAKGFIKVTSVPLRVFYTNHPDVAKDI